MKSGLTDHVNTRQWTEQMEILIGLETNFVGFDIPIPKKKIGRPKADLKTESKTPSILNFFKAFPVIPKPSSINNRSISSNQPSGSSNKAEEQTRKSGMEAVRIDAKKDESDTDLEDEDDEDLIDVLEPQSDSFEEDTI